METPREDAERNPDQAWFWTPEWQAKEREADAAIREGRFTRFDSVEEFLADFNRGEETHET